VTEYVHPTPPAIVKPVHPDSTLVLILGILSLVMCGLFTGIPGIVIGARGLRAVRDSNGTLDPGALKPGLVMSIVGTALTVVMIVLVVVLIAIAVALHRHGVHFDQTPTYTGVNT
jgi:hypothetical protein